jgi:hypothetical protein
MRVTHDLLVFPDSGDGLGSHLAGDLTIAGRRYHPMFRGQNERLLAGEASRAGCHVTLGLLESGFHGHSLRI